MRRTGSGSRGPEAVAGSCVAGNRDRLGRPGALQAGFGGFVRREAGYKPLCLTGTDAAGGANGHLSFVTPGGSSGANARALVADRRAKLVEEMREGGVVVTAERTNANQSGVSKSYDFVGQENAILSVQRYVNQIERWVFKMWLLLAHGKPLTETNLTIVSEYPSEYKPSVSVELIEISDALNLMPTGATEIRKRLRLEMLKKILGQSVTSETVEEMANELSGLSESMEE